MAGDIATGVSIMRMDAGLDTGPVCLSRDVAIAPDMNAGALHDMLSRLGAELMVEALAKLEAGSLKAVPQPSQGVTYAAKIDKGETRIDFTRSAAEVVNHVRGLSPAPGAWFEAGFGGRPERIRVLAAEQVSSRGQPGVLVDDNLTIACGDSAIRVQQLQRAGKQPMAASDFLRGARIAAGTRLA
jgi:methionyl-tRNA formyltransferase